MADPPQCWGKVLTGRECRKGYYTPIGQGPFYTHFCAACALCRCSLPESKRANGRSVSRSGRPCEALLAAVEDLAVVLLVGQQLGIEVPAVRIRMLPPPPNLSLANSASNGVWSGHHRLPRYRIVNQTKRCRGPAAIIFESPPSEAQCLGLQLPEAAGPLGSPPIGPITLNPLPSAWSTMCSTADYEVVHFAIAHSTLVPTCGAAPRPPPPEPEPPPAALTAAAGSSEAATGQGVLIEDNATAAMHPSAAHTAPRAPPPFQPKPPPAAPLAATSAFRSVQPIVQRLSPNRPPLGAHPPQYAPGGYAPLALARVMPSAAPPPQLQFRSFMPGSVAFPPRMCIGALGGATMASNSHCVRMVPMTASIAVGAPLPPPPPPVVGRLHAPLQQHHHQQPQLQPPIPPQLLPHQPPAFAPAMSEPVYMVQPAPAVAPPPPPQPLAPAPAQPQPVPEDPCEVKSAEPRRVEDEALAAVVLSGLSRSGAWKQSAKGLSPPKASPSICSAPRFSISKDKASMLGGRGRGCRPAATSFVQ